MDIPHRCQEMKADVERALAAAPDDAARTEVIVRALYRCADEVLRELGPPGRSEQHLKGQAAALDLVTFLCLPLVRAPRGERDLVSVLAEVGESTRDPVLQRKLARYARQLLDGQTGSGDDPIRRAAGVGGYCAAVGAFAALLLAGYLGLREGERSSVLSRDGGGGAGSEIVLAPPAGEHPVPSPRENNPVPREGARPALRLERQEQVTKIRVVANQVLVPATVRNGAESVKVTLLLDTGSTRTALGEPFAARLGIDLSRARGSLVEVADGRVLHSKLATVDQVAVGTRSVPSFEMEFFPYGGTDQGFDGFLGMDFLGRQRYQLDVENEVIRWQ